MAPPTTRGAGFSRRRQYGVFLSLVVTVVGALIGVGLLLLSTFNPGAFSVVRGGVREVTTPVSTGLDMFRRGIADIPTGISRFWGVKTENDQLRKQLAANEALIQRARTLSFENRRLRALLNVRDRTIDSVVTARLVSSSAMSTRRFANLNAGSGQGVLPGQPVRGPEGLIGQVLETSPNTARVLLIIDPESIVPVRRTRDGLPAFAAGRGDGLIDIKVADVTDVPLLAGDNFVTSGAGGIYPPGIPVARVLRNARDSAVARAFANPDALDFALVQRAFMPEALKPTPSPTPSPSPKPSAKASAAADH